MKLKFNIFGITTDRRSSDLQARYATIEQARADAALEIKWRQSVRLNEWRRLLKDTAIFSRRHTS